MELSQLQGTVTAWARRKGWAEELTRRVYPMPRLDPPLETVPASLARIALEHAGLSERAEQIRRGGALSYLPIEATVVDLLRRLDNARLRVDFDLIGVLKKLALVHTEVSEAVDAALNHALTPGLSWLWLADSGKPEGLASELADVVIRCFQLAGDLDLDLPRAISEKLAFNESREHRHGGRLA